MTFVEVKHKSLSESVRFRDALRLLCTRHSSHSSVEVKEKLSQQQTTHWCAASHRGKRVSAFSPVAAELSAEWRNVAKHDSSPSIKRPLRPTRGDMRRQEELLLTGGRPGISPNEAPPPSRQLSSLFVQRKPMTLCAGVSGG